VSGSRLHSRDVHPFRCMRHSAQHVTAWTTAAVEGRRSSSSLALLPLWPRRRCRLAPCRVRRVGSATVVWRTLESALELLFCVIESSWLQQRGCQRLANRIVPVRWLHVRGVEMAADAIVDMAWHAHEVARAGNGVAQPIGVRFGAFRPVRRLNRVDIVRWILGEHAL